MKNLLILISFLYISPQLFGQIDSNFIFTKMSAKDSIDFNPFWNQFKSNIFNSDTSEIRLKSLQFTKCDICTNSESEYLSIDSLLLNIIPSLKSSPLWSAIQQNRINLKKRRQQNSDKKITPKGYGDLLTTYEVWIQTYKPNEFAAGHEGQSHCFQFIRHNDNFKLFGITSIP